MLGRQFTTGILIGLAVLAAACSAKLPADLPKDLLGIRIGMPKAEAQKQLELIGSFQRDEQPKQQVWSTRNDPRFGAFAIGYDRDDRIRYITAFVDKTMRERIKFTDVGDISKAKQEIQPPHYRYIWIVPAADGMPEYQVNIYGDNPDKLTMFSLAGTAPVIDEDEEREDQPGKDVDKGADKDRGKGKDRNKDKDRDKDLDKDRH